MLPGIPVCISTEINSEFREYERGSTTVLNAWLRPVMDHYLQSLSELLHAEDGLGLAPGKPVMVMDAAVKQDEGRDDQSQDAVHRHPQYGPGDRAAATSGGGVQWGVAAAVMVVAALPPLVLGLVMYRRIFYRQHIFYTAVEIARHPVC